MNIYNFECPYEYLNAIWTQKKNANSKFSLRSWSKKLDFGSNTTLSLLLNKKRSFTKLQAMKIGKYLELNEIELKYFFTLIDCSNSSSPEEEELYLNLIHIQKSGQKTIGKDLSSFEYLSSPENILIFECFNLKGFKPDLAWIKNILKLKISSSKISIYLKNLKNLKLVKEGKNGLLKKTTESFNFSWDIEDADLASLIYHKNILKITQNSIEKNLTPESKLSSYFFSIHRSRVKEAKKELRRLNTEFITKFESKPGEGDQVFQFCYYFYPVTK